MRQRAASLEARRGWAASAASRLRARWIVALAPLAFGLTTLRRRGRARPTSVPIGASRPLHLGSRARPHFWISDRAAPVSDASQRAPVGPKAPPPRPQRFHPARWRRRLPPMADLAGDPLAGLAAPNHRHRQRRTRLHRSHVIGILRSRSNTPGTSRPHPFDTGLSRSASLRIVGVRASRWRRV